MHGLGCKVCLGEDMILSDKDGRIGSGFKTGYGFYPAIRAVNWFCKLVLIINWFYKLVLIIRAATLIITNQGSLISSLSLYQYEIGQFRFFFFRSKGFNIHFCSALPFKNEIVQKILACLYLIQAAIVWIISHWSMRPHKTLRLTPTPKRVSSMHQIYKPHNIDATMPMQHTCSIRIWYIIKLQLLNSKTHK